MLLELLRFATKSKGGRHARCSKSKAPDIISSDVDWEISVIGLASRNWDSAFNSEGDKATISLFEKSSIISEKVT